MIKRNIIIGFAITLSSLFGASLMTQTTFAATCGGANTSIISCDGDGQDAIMNVLKMIIQIMTVGIGVLAVGAVIFGAILYSSSAGSPENIKKAKTIWMNTVLGLILFAFMVAITNFLIPGGVFG